MQSRDIGKIEQSIGSTVLVVIYIMLFIVFCFSSTLRAEVKSYRTSNDYNKLMSEAKSKNMVRMEEEEGKVLSNALIDGTSVRAPLGRFLLLRQGKSYCALKFISFHHTGSYEKDNWHHYAEYEWYYSEQQVGRLTGQKLLSGREKLDAGQAKQSWHFISIPGNYLIRCGGNFKLPWVWPTGVPLNDGFSSRSNGVEVAPTHWENVNDVDFSEPSLIWYYIKDIHNEPRKETIPIEKLPPIATPHSQ